MAETKCPEKTIDQFAIEWATEESPRNASALLFHRMRNAYLVGATQQRERDAKIAEGAAGLQHFRETGDDTCVECAKHVASAIRGQK